MSAGAAALAAAQARAATQLQVLESQIASKDAGLEAADVRLQAFEAELRSANSKVGCVMARQQNLLLFLGFILFV